MSECQKLLSMQDAVAINGHRFLEPIGSASGLQTFAAKQANAVVRRQQCLAEEFLVNSRLDRDNVDMERSILEYFTDAVALLTTLSDSGSAADTIRLPPGVPSEGRCFDDVVVARRSVRKYSGEPMTLPEVATILRYAAGARDESREDGVGRRVPSAGGLYPIRLYLAAQAVSGLEEGVYEYQPRLDGLVCVGGTEELRRTRKAFGAPESIIQLSKAAAVFFIVGRPWRAIRKYGDRGLRHVFIEAGSTAQNLHLTVTALGLHSVDTASFYDQEIHNLLALDGSFDALIHCVVVGRPARVQRTST